MVATSGGLSILPVTVRRPESLFVNHLIVEKNHHHLSSRPVGIRYVQDRKKNVPDPAIEAADARRTLSMALSEMGFRIIQVVAGVYIVVQLIQVLLR